MNNETKGVGIPCGHNPLVLGSVVDGEAQIFGEIVTVLSGDIIFGKLTRLVVYTECDFLRLSVLYEKHKNNIQPCDILYVVVTNGLSGTIYACGHSKRGEWTVFAKTAGYA
ncbi:hypothetical protein [Streptococcus suis]|uniref:hypothetical protein n=1 Tax=Streptococcus suis TaxID=1307 RepID=UPI00240FB245|nr:hypothetical protein [Streptococcus suis]MDG3136747.1 hypothetical protein [Streptococcus suis]